MFNAPKELGIQMKQMKKPSHKQAFCLVFNNCYYRNRNPIQSQFTNARPASPREVTRFCFDTLTLG